jgi:hypothetical protein
MMTSHQRYLQFLHHCNHSCGLLSIIKET